MVGGDEQCDGANLNGQTCQSITMMAQAVGMLSCDSTCHFIVSGCNMGAGGGTGSGGGTGTGGM